MPIPTTLFAILLGVAALVGLVMAVRDWSRGPAGRSRATGLLIFAVAAGVQVVNLLTGYNWLVSGLTTLGLFAGLWMGLPRPRRVT